MAVTHPKTQALWEKLRRPNCTRCSLSAGTDEVCILGTGPTPAKWMLVGEAPGSTSGMVGQYFERTLQRFGLRLADFYVTSVVKCSTGGKKASKKQTVACSPYLRAEIRAHKPEYVVLMGAPAVKAVLGIDKIMENRQRVVRVDGQKYFIILHPAASLHRPNLRAAFEDDIGAFARIVKGLDEVAPTRVHLVNDEQAFQKFLRKLSDEPRVAFDIETDGNQYLEVNGRLGTITLFGASFKPGEAWVVVLDHAEGWAPARWKQMAARIGKAMFRPGKKIIAHNAKFDVRWFLEYVPEAESTFDTIVAAFLLNENRSMSLENLALSELHVKPWKAGVQYRRDYPLSKYAVYNAKDVDYTMRLYELYRDQLANQRPLANLFIRLLMPAVNIFTRIEHRGVYVPGDRLEARLTEARQEEARIRGEILKMVPPVLHPINIGSPQQVARFLYSKEGLGLPFPVEAKKTKSGNLSTSENALKLLKHPVTALIERWRFLKTKAIATYFLRWKRLRDSRGYVHFSYNLIGAITGRISSDLHQVPRDPFVRGVVGVKEGYFGASDFSQIEMRIVAHLSRDRKLMRIFQTGGDAHLNTAVKLTKQPADKIDSETRKKAKAVNFGFLYGMFERKFRDYAREKYDIWLTMPESKQYRREYFEEYEDILPWHNRQVSFAQRHKEVRYLDGRVRRLPDIDSENEAAADDAGRQAINSPVQGLASDMCLLTMVIGEYGGFGFEPIVDENFKWIGQLHDEVQFWVQEGYENIKIPQVVRLMENLPLQELFGFEFVVPIIAEAKYGRFWGDAKPWKAEEKSA